MYSPIENQHDMYWGPEKLREVTKSSVWVSLIYLTRFPLLRPLVEFLANEVEKGNLGKVVLLLKKIMSHAKMVKSFTEKGKFAVTNQSGYNL